MHRQGADPDNMTPADFLCDFCGQSWSEDRPFVEGHRGSCICGNCLTLAYLDLVLHRSAETTDKACTMCLETRPDEPHWPSPVLDGKFICARCTRQSAGVLHKDPDIAWTKPGSPGDRGD